MILVTSAYGHVGSEIVKALASRSLPVRAFGHAGNANASNKISGIDYVDGDFFDPPILRSAFNGVDQVFHIGPPESPGEFAIGQAMINLAAEFKIRQFVYFSVIHPYIAALAHHQTKLLVQQYLVDSGVPYTILQPTIFLQTAGIEKVIQGGPWKVPYSIDMPMSYIDLDDVAEAAVIVLTESKHLRATYELVGTDPISVREMAEVVSNQTGRNIEAETISPESIVNHFPRTSVPEAYKANDLEHMMVYYNRHGLTGNSYVLESLLGRAPNTLISYLKKIAGE